MSDQPRPHWVVPPKPMDRYILEKAGRLGWPLRWHHDSEHSTRKKALGMARDIHEHFEPGERDGRYYTFRVIDSESLADVTNMGPEA